MRGIAALMVALCHCLLVLSVDGLNNIWFATFSELAGVQSAITRFLLLFFNGGAAVVVFFVLSGYVLGLSLDKSGLSIQRVFGFYIKRVFRLYPAHIVVLLAIVALLLAFFEYRTFGAASAWYGEWYRAEIGTGKILRNAALVQVDLNHIAWSLQVELAGSLFLPFAYRVARRAALWLNLLALGALVALSWYSHNLYLIFLYCFYAGLILPQVSSKAKTLLSGKSGALALAIGASLLFGGFTLAGPQSLFGRVLLETAGGVLVIAYLLTPDNSGSGFNRFLDHDLINRLGRYSYSFYLIHFVLLYGTACLMFQWFSTEVLAAMPLLFGFGLMLVSVPVTFWLAGKVYQFVEVPMIGFGRVVVAGLSRKNSAS